MEYWSNGKIIGFTGRGERKGRRGSANGMLGCWARIRKNLILIPLFHYSNTPFPQ